MSSNVLQPNPPPQPKKIKAMFPQYPSATPQKSPSSSLSLHPSVPDLCGLFWVLLGQTFTEKTGNSEPSLYPPPLSLSSLFLLYYYYSWFFLITSSLSLYSVSSLSHPSLWSMSKKLKGVSSGSNPYSAYEDARTKMRHQSLMQDYQELREVSLCLGFYVPHMLQIWCFFLSINCWFSLISVWLLKSHGRIWTE